MTLHDLSCAKGLASSVKLTCFMQDELSLRFELTGGFIKNAILSALSIAVSRDGDNPVVCQKDLLQGANLQLRGRLRMRDFDRRVVPVAGLDEVIVEEPVMKQLREIVQFEKARYWILFPCQLLIDTSSLCTGLCCLVSGALQSATIRV